MQRQHHKKRAQFCAGEYDAPVFVIVHLEFAEKRDVHESTVPRTAGGSVVETPSQCCDESSSANLR